MVCPSLPHYGFRLRASLDTLWKLPTLKVVEEVSGVAITETVEEKRGFLPLKAAAVERGVRRALLRHNEAVTKGGWPSGSTDSLRSYDDDLGIRITTTSPDDDEDDLCFDGEDLCPTSWNIGSDSLFDGNLEDTKQAGPPSTTMTGASTSTASGGVGEGHHALMEGSQLRDRLVSSGSAGPGPSSSCAFGTPPPPSLPSARLPVPAVHTGGTDEGQVVETSAPPPGSLPSSTSPALISSASTQSLSGGSLGGSNVAVQGGMPSNGKAKALTQQQLRLEALLSTVVPFDSVNFKSSKALSASARRGINVRRGQGVQQQQGNVCEWA